MKIRQFAVALALPLLACAAPSSPESSQIQSEALDGSNVQMELGASDTLHWASGIDAKGAMHSLRVFRSVMSIREPMKDGTSTERRFSMLRHLYATNGAPTLEVIGALAPWDGQMLVYVRSREGTVACNLDKSGDAFGFPGRVSAWSVKARGDITAMGSETLDASTPFGGLGKACIAAVGSVAHGHLDDVAYFSPALRTLLQGNLTLMQQTPGHNKGVAISAATAGGIALGVGLAAAAIATSPVTLTVGAGIAIGVLAAELGVLVGDAITHHYDGTDKPPPNNGGGGGGRGSGGGASNDPGTDDSAWADMVAAAEADDTPEGGFVWAGPDPDCYPPAGSPGGGNGSGSGFDCVPENQFASGGIHLTRWCQ